MHKEAIWLSAELKRAGMFTAMRALYFAAECHEGHERDDGTDYIDHPVGVARLLMNLASVDEATIISALLHDVIEEEKIARRDIAADYGKEVAGIVHLLSKSPGRKVPLEVYYDGIKSNIRAILIKAADRHHNVSNMTAYPVDRLAKYVAETREYVLPMMKEARREHPEWATTLIILRDSMKGVLSLAERLIAVEREREDLKGRFVQQEEWLAEARVRRMELERQLNEREDAFCDGPLP